MSHKLPLGMRHQRQESSGRQYVRHNQLTVTMAGFAGQMLQTFVTQQDLRRQVERIILDRRISGPFKGFWLPVYWTRHYYRVFEDWRVKLFQRPEKSTEQVQQPVERYPGGMSETLRKDRPGEYIPVPPDAD